LFEETETTYNELLLVLKTKTLDWLKRNLPGTNTQANLVVPLLRVLALTSVVKKLFFSSILDSGTRTTGFSGLLVAKNNYSC